MFVGLYFCLFLETSRSRRTRKTQPTSYSLVLEPSSSRRCEGTYRTYVTERQRRNATCYKIKQASPKLKKRYSFSTAYLYTDKISSLPVRQATSIISVLSGRWKLVISASTHFILYGGYKKISVFPEQARTNPFSSATLSNVLTEVVPTAITRLPSALVDFLHRIFFDFIEFGVHFVVGDNFLTNGSKRTQAHVQQYLGNFHAFIFNAP